MNNLRLVTATPNIRQASLGIEILSFPHFDEISLTSQFTPAPSTFERNISLVTLNYTILSRLPQCAEAIEMAHT
jgi:hypothetical protein